MRTLLLLAAWLLAWPAAAQQWRNIVYPVIPKGSKVATTAPAAKWPPDTVAGPGVKVGDTWIYNKLRGRDGSLEHVSLNVVRSVGAAGILMDSSNLDGSQVYKVRRTAAFNLVDITGEDGSVQGARPFYPNFSFPLKVGKTWRQPVEFTIVNRPGDYVRADLEARVVGWESVTVPAGTFLALKIEMGGWYRGRMIDNWPLDGHIEDTAWYSPEVRNVVRYEYKDTAGVSVFNHEVQELMRYWLAP